RNVKSFVKTIAYTACLSVVLTGCETVGTVLNTTSAVLSATDTILSAATGTTPSTSSLSSSSLSPRPTVEQQQKIDGLTFKASNAQIQQAINEAKPNIQKMLRMTSCFKTKNMGTITTAKASSLMHSPSFTYHPDGKCVDVSRIYGWEMPAKNVLKFVVVYSSEISGETRKCKVEMRHEYDEWLVYEHWIS
ncbi:MAG: hypothetical protein IKN18_01035, partial [Neisseriaceae bacterium]|nr:hypothetical protein [Neisseriaceae bacterium]